MTDNLPNDMLQAGAEAIYAYAKATFNHAAGTAGPEDWMDEARAAVSAALRVLAAQAGPSMLTSEHQLNQWAARVEHPAEDGER